MLAVGTNALWEIVHVSSSGLILSDVSAYFHSSPNYARSFKCDNFDKLALEGQ